MDPWADSCFDWRMVEFATPLKYAKMYVHFSREQVLISISKGTVT